MNAIAYTAEIWDSWLPINKAAPIVGCSDQTLRNAVAGTNGRPKLECKPDKKLGLCVVPRQARAHVLKYCRVKTCDLNVPPELAEVVSGAQKQPANTSATTSGGLIIDPEISAALNGADPMSFSPADLALRLTLAGVDGFKVKPLIQAVNSLQRKHEADTRAGKNLAPEDVVLMLRSFGELFVEEIDERSPVFGRELLGFLRTNFGVDVSVKHANAADILAKFFSDQFGNKTIVQLRKLVEDQVRGVQYLEMT
jgi:hypothetical protein